MLLLAAHGWFVYGNKPVSEREIKREIERQAGLAALITDRKPQAGKPGGQLVGLGGLALLLSAVRAVDGIIDVDGRLGQAIDDTERPRPAEQDESETLSSPVAARPADLAAEGEASSWPVRSPSR